MPKHHRLASLSHSDIRSNAPYMFTEAEAGFEMIITPHPDIAKTVEKFSRTSIIYDLIRKNIGIANL